MFSKVGANLELRLLQSECTKTSLPTHEIKFVGILVYEPYMKSELYKYSSI